MAGSYNHVVDKDGKLLETEELLGMLDTHSGDVYEFAEEAYGMIWYLATTISPIADPEGLHARALVETARRNYKLGLKRSPGTDGTLPEDDE